MQTKRSDVSRDNRLFLAAGTQSRARTTGRRRNNARRSSLRYALADRFDLLNPIHWQAACGTTSPFASTAYYRALEEQGPGNVEYRFGLIYEGSKPLAAVVFQLAEISRTPYTPGSQSAGEILQSYSRALRRRSRVAPKSTQARRALICGDLFSGAPPVYCQPDADIGRVWQGVAELIERVLEQEQFSLERDLVVIKDTTPENLAAFSLLRDKNYQRIRVEPDYQLPLSSRFECYTDFMDQLNPAQRKAIGKLRRERDDVGLSSRVLRKEADLEVIHGIEFQPLIDHTIFPSTWSYGEFIDTLHQDGLLSHTAFRVFTLRDIPVAFTSVVRDGATAYNHFWGVTPGVRLPACLPESMLHAVVEDAIQFSCRNLVLGKTSAREKVRIGAQAVPREAWVLHRNDESPIDLAPLFRVVGHEASNPIPSVRVVTNA